MFDKITNYLDAASNNIKVASAKMERHSEEMVIRAEDSFFEEFGVSYEDHKAAQAQDTAILKAAAKHAKAARKAEEAEAIAKAKADLSWNPFVGNDYWSWGAVGIMLVWWSIAGLFVSAIVLSS